MGIDSLKNLYVDDPYFGEAYKVCLTISNSYCIDFVDYLIQDGLLFKGSHLYIPKCSMRTNIIQEKHYGIMGGHFGIDKTLDIVKRSYHWPKMINDVKKFVQSCTICQQAKGTTTNQGLYQPLLVMYRPWESIWIDFFGVYQELNRASIEFLLLWTDLEKWHILSLARAQRMPHTLLSFSLRWWLDYMRYPRQ